MGGGVEGEGHCGWKGGGGGRAVEGGRGETCGGWGGAGVGVEICLSVKIPLRLLCGYLGFERHKHGMGGEASISGLQFDKLLIGYPLSWLSGIPRTDLVVLIKSLLFSILPMRKRQTQNKCQDARCGCWTTTIRDSFACSDHLLRPTRFARFTTRSLIYSFLNIPIFICIYQYGFVGFLSRVL